MSKFIEKHLESITAEKLMKFRSEAFVSMASIWGRSGSFFLGVNGAGEFVVKTKAEVFTFADPIDAIDKYSKLVSNE